MNLFGSAAKCALVHCISSDFVMGAGIAKQFALAGVKKELLSTYPQVWEGRGYCLHSSAGTKNADFPNGVFNLITKQYYYCKPTYDTMQQALDSMKKQCAELNIEMLAMPMIGCGLDRLDWARVSKMVQDTFRDTGIHIYVAIFEKQKTWTVSRNSPEVDR